MDHQSKIIRAAIGAWLAARTSREKLILGAALVLLLVLLIYNVLWAPAYDGRMRIEASLPQLELQLAEIRQQADEVSRLRAAAAIHAPSGAGLRDALAASLTEAGLMHAQVTLHGSNVQIDAKNVPFDLWITWLAEIRRDFHVRVLQAHVIADGAPGQTSITATVQSVSD